MAQNVAMLWHSPRWDETAMTCGSKTVILVSFTSAVDWDEFRLWLTDPRHPGEWDFMHVDSPGERTDTWLFGFTDPEVAFEFKLRFV